MVPLRSWLFVPGNQLKMIDKSHTLDIDVAILDLEDGVPEAEKDKAKILVSDALRRPNSLSQRFVRIRSSESGEAEADLRATFGPGLDGIVLPKVDQTDDVSAISELLEQLERSLERAPVRLLATIESARGLIQAPAIAGSSSRLAGLLFGAEDYCRDLGIFNIDEDCAEALLYARSSIVVAAVSAGVQAIDRVFPQIRDLDGLRDDARRARRLGFSGKAVIHPEQIDIVHQEFRAAQDEVESALRIVQAFEEAEISGCGTVEVNGRMVDRPVVERARRILQLHRPLQEKD